MILLSYLLLGIAILSEVFGSTMLKLSNGFTRILPVAGVIAGFGLAFYLLSISLKTLPLGVVYATWSGCGTILTVAVGILFFKEKMNKQGIAGIFLLIIGLVLLNS
ncbi:DMT family transporter [Bacillus badius]|uniref:Ethidium bromide-methyl viologen resistance protein EmrE n=1 Tax=Bacillus badius TaxID=1455 RepID=A0ABR5AXF8_BACBA|nr:multidrug efflux SMR transporter [Bacillus badius]KIL76018.1 Ethidium bromide-methyl viologen resistance protein EmrE [Bacillus badius]KIL79422.1 Ethidium bromide-methyl viologen resistance protein EmrE [Bacillus badius]KZR59660.1 transporter [Bacillus badius]MED4716597.1 multidrug efflux SMR transporter [Bacillus badius]